MLPIEEKTDTRKLPREDIEKKRHQAHKLRKRGLTQAEIGEIVEAHDNTVGRWLKLNQKNFKVNHGGLKTGDGID